MLSIEHSFWDRDPGLVLAGVDEVGRGPLAGPVYASAVVIAPADADSFLEGPLAGLTDSKKLTEAARERFCALLRSLPDVRIGIGSASVAEIDSMNILRATHLAMRRAVEALSVQPDCALIDGNGKPGLAVEQRTIVKGDSKSVSVAAASILAKVTRDRYMKMLDEQYPQYAFAQHKGYGTKLHYERIAASGLCPEHRRTFLRKVLEQTP